MVLVDYVIVEIGFFFKGLFFLDLNYCFCEWDREGKEGKIGLELGFCWVCLYSWF